MNGISGGGNQTDGGGGGGKIVFVAIMAVTVMLHDFVDEDEKNE